MPKKKMQNGGTFLGPFATQADQITPRQQFAPGFVPTRTGTTGPTIGLPGQDPIDTGQERKILPISQEEIDRRKKVTQQDQLQQMRAEIDPNVVSGPIDIDAAIAGGAKAGMSRDQVLASTPAFQQTLVGYDPNDPRFTESLSWFQSGMRGLANPKTWATVSLAAFTGGAALAIPALGYAAAKNIKGDLESGRIDKLSFTPTTTAEPDVTRQTFDTSKTLDPFAADRALMRTTVPISKYGPGWQDMPLSTTDPFAADRAQMRTTVAATNAGIVGSELFSNDPTYAGGAKTGSDGLYASGGSGAFTSMAHYNAGISQLDESNIVAQGINSGSFTNAQEGRGTIDDLIESGYGETEINDIVNTGRTVSDINTQAREFAASYGQQGKKEEAPQIDVDASPKVICAELYRQGLLEKEIFELDEEFGRHLRKVDPDLITSYHQWALPLVSLMQRSIVVSHIIKIIARPVVKHIAYQMGYPSKTYLGAALFTIGKHICRYIAKKEMAHA